MYIAGKIKILENESEIQRQQLIYDLSNLVTDIIIDFWKLIVARKNFQTAQQLLKNLNNIYSITLRKKRIGLAESFELSQWRSLISKAKIQLANAKLERDSLERDLLRTLNVQTSQRIGKTILVESIPKNIEETKDIQFAYANRPDYKFIQLQRKNAQARLEIAKNQLLPSLSVGAKYTSRGFDQKIRGVQSASAAK